jgi:CRISPR system Cascade subunit CasD
MKMDYQTAGGGLLRDGRTYGVRKASGKAGETVISNRYYLADADFLVGLEGSDGPLLRRLHDALMEPTWQLFLGRKSFVPGVPVHVPGGLRDAERLEIALTRYPWPRPDMDVPPPARRPDRLRMVVEAAARDGHEVRMDQPYGASFMTRTFLPRYVVNLFREVGSEDDDVPVREDAEEEIHVSVTTDH